MSMIGTIGSLTGPNPRKGDPETTPTDAKGKVEKEAR